MFSEAVGNLTDWLDDIAGNWWFLLVILAIALLDSVIPVVPSETCVIIGGVAAAHGEQVLVLVIACAAIGAFAGDNLACQIGRLASGPVRRLGERKPKFGKRLQTAGDQIRERGGLLLITARFVPGGRTVLTLSCGLTRQPLPWFAGWVGVAAVLWGGYAALLGFIGGRTFENNHTAAFLLAFGGALALTAVSELIRWIRGRRTRAERR